MSEQPTIASVADIKGRSLGAPVELPSGIWVRMRNPGLDVFLRKGMIPDSLTAMVRRALSGKEGNQSLSEEDLQDVAGDPDKISEILGLFDSVLLECWTEPKVHAVPEKPEDRRDDLLYVDEVGMDDKMFTFQFAVGGVKDLESFREQQEAMLARLSPGEDVERPSE